MKQKRIYLHLVIFLLIYLEFGYRIVVTQFIPGMIRNMLLLLISASLFLFKMIKGEYLISKKQVLLFVWLMVICTISSVRDQNLENTIILMISIITGFMFAATVRIDDAIEIFINIMYFLAIYSLILFVLNIIAPQITQRLPSLGQRFIGSRAEVKDAFFSVCLVNSFTHRNYGLAWEPGAFSLLLCIALYCYIVFDKHFEIKKVFVFVIAIATTFSTMGYIVMAIIMITTYVPKRRDRKRRKAFYAIAVCVFFALLFNYELIYEMVFEKLSGLFLKGENQLVVTTSARVNAIKYPILTFLHSPIFGIGYDDFWYMNVVYCNNVATNTILNWYALAGIVFGVPLTYGYLRLVYYAGKHARMNRIKILLLLMASILLVSTESLLRISLIYVLVFYGCLAYPFQVITEKDISI